MRGKVKGSRVFGRVMGSTVARAPGPRTARGGPPERGGLDRASWFPWLADGGHGPAVVIEHDHPDAFLARVADLDGDADADLVVASGLPYALAWYENGGAGGTSSRANLTGPFDGAGDVALSDVDVVGFGGHYRTYGFTVAVDGFAALPGGGLEVRQAVLAQALALALGCGSLFSESKPGQVVTVDRVAGASLIAP